MRSKAAVVVASVVTLGVLEAACGPSVTSTSPTTTTAATAGSVDTRPTVPPDTAQQGRVGQSLTCSQQSFTPGYGAVVNTANVTLERIVDPAPPTGGRVPGPGERYVEALWRVQNVGTHHFSVSDSSLVLHGTTESDISGGSSPPGCGPEFRPTDLYPGETAEGWTAYDAFAAGPITTATFDAGASGSSGKCAEWSIP